MFSDYNCFQNFNCELFIFKSSVLNNAEVKELDVELTQETQFQALENVITPLCRKSYDTQLIIKQQWTYSISKVIRSRLHNVKTPIRMPKIHSISSSVSGYLIKLYGL